MIRVIPCEIREQGERGKTEEQLLETGGREVVMGVHLDEVCCMHG